MENNENTFFYKRNLTIGKDTIEITPEIGDSFYVCKDKDVAYKSAVDSHDRFDPEYEHITETYSTEDLGEGVSGYQMCKKLAIGGNEYNFVGLKVVMGEITMREFYLY